MKRRTGYLFKRGDNFYVGWKVNGKAFAICSPDGNHALTLEDAEKLLKELNHK